MNAALPCQRRTSVRHQRFAIALVVLFISGLLLACGATSLPISDGPRWACPSPVPDPWGESGPVKEYHNVGAPDPTTGIQQKEPVYYEQWEQEYGDSGSLLNGLPAYSGPPFPSPTPYGQLGMTYAFGQRVELAPLHVIVRAEADTRLSDTLQRYRVIMTWNNPGDQPIPFDYPMQVWLRSIIRADGTQQIGDGWAIDRASANELSLDIPTSIAPGESRVVLPILAPPGRPKTVEIRMPITFMQIATPESGTAAPSPTPNTDLRNPNQRWLTVQWVDAQPVGPPCDSAGALTDWSSNGNSKAIPRDAAIGLNAPAGAPQVVRIALNQVGKRYVWGTTGPNTFDCSGLMQWSYAQIGIGIPRTTETQWHAMKPMALTSIQPGDLVYMDTRDDFGGTPIKIRHVGMLADVDGDGKWDLIHAASPRLGVRIDYDVFRSNYYAPRLFGEGRTAR
jgi:cell wall-associated NlpC family hydrolase